MGQGSVVPELFWFLIAAVAIAGVGIAFGMLLAPRIARLGERMSGSGEASEGDGDDRPADR